MSKNKKSLSLEELAKIKIEGEKIREKTPEEIAREQSEKEKLASLLIKVSDSNFHKVQKSPVSTDREAKAPYNFVPLNDKIVLSDFDVSETPFDKYHTESFTGFIGLTIEAKTPLYIRDTYTEDQLKEIKRLDDAIDEAKKTGNWNEVNRLENEKIDLLWRYNDFYSPGNGEVKLPGSTQRGLIKELVEIASFGKFENFEDKRLYMRGFADCALRSQYNSFGMSTFRGGRPTYTMQCGVLNQKGNKYFISDCGFPTQITITNTRTRVTSLGKVYSDYEFYEDAAASEYIVVSGPIPRKQNDWLIPFPASTATQIILTDEDIKEYNDDDNRVDKVNLLKRLSSCPSGIPCFYKQWTDDSGNTRTTFGHTGMFRVPYKKTIAQHVPDELTNTNKPDFAEAIFGNEIKYVGRVFFEDAVCTKLVSFTSAKYPKILSSSKPTTFQHYLTQPDERRDYLKHYNPDNTGKLSELRGYKLYWHKEDYGWYVEEATAQASKKQYTKIKPVDVGTTFKGKIRFENLSNVELGALLFTLQLPVGCYHKIGMAKPLGLGSVEITPKLFLSKRDERYISLGSEWKIPIEESTNKINIYKNAFATYVLRVLNQEVKNYSADDLWVLERMKELKKMLTFNHGIQLNKLEYMDLGEFTKRQVLPKPSDV